MYGMLFSFFLSDFSVIDSLQLICVNGLWNWSVKYISDYCVIGLYNGLYIKRGSEFACKVFVKMLQWITILWTLWWDLELTNNCSVNTVVRFGTICLLCNPYVFCCNLVHHFLSYIYTILEMKKLFKNDHLHVNQYMNCCSTIN
jgi:hypothetical protein